jgi:hypothetical protein
VAATLLVAGVAFATRYPERAAAFLLLWTAGAAASFTLFLAARRAPQRLIVPMTVVFTIVPAVMLIGTATEPRAILAMTSGFTMLPVAGTTLGRTYGSVSPASLVTSAPHSWVWPAGGSGGPS